MFCILERISNVCVCVWLWLGGELLLAWGACQVFYILKAACNDGGYSEQLALTLGSYQLLLDKVTRL